MKQNTNPMRVLTLHARQRNNCFDCHSSILSRQEREVECYSYDIIDADAQAQEISDSSLAIAFILKRMIKVNIDMNPMLLMNELHMN